MKKDRWILFPYITYTVLTFQEHMNQVRARRHPKVIFLVEQGALAQQQAKMCIKYLPCKVKLITGETQRNERQKSFSEWLAKYV